LSKAGASCVTGDIEIFNGFNNSTILHTPGDNERHRGGVACRTEERNGV